MGAEGATDSRKSGLAEALPKLRECPGKELCAECFWWVDNGGQCQGCDDDYQQRCVKRVCGYNCYVCSGGRKAHTPGCCGRTLVLWQSWRDRLKNVLDYPVAAYAPAPLEIKCRLIPVIYPEVTKFGIPEQFPQIDAWAVPIHKVAGRKGRFYSKDLKYYLGLPPDKKLILVTCAPDDYQETLWDNGAQMKYKEHGIDYWFPGHFSIYDDDSKLYQFISAKRQQIHAIQTKSQFVWFRLGENIPVEFLNPVRSAPSVLISTNQMYTKRNIDILLNEVAIADSWFPPKTSFFIIGNPRRLGLSDKRKCFEINTNWLMRALRGRDLAGKPQFAKGVKFSKEEKFRKMFELLTNNLSEAVKNV